MKRISWIQIFITIRRILDSQYRNESRYFRKIFDFNFIDWINRYIFLSSFKKKKKEQKNETFLQDLLWRNTTSWPSSPMPSCPHAFMVDHDCRGNKSIESSHFSSVVPPWWRARGSIITIYAFLNSGRGTVSHVWIARFCGTNDIKGSLFVTSK